jgi:hypothetical protein
MVLTFVREKVKGDWARKGLNDRVQSFHDFAKVHGQYAHKVIWDFDFVLQWRQSCTAVPIVFDETDRAKNRRKANAAQFHSAKERHLVIDVRALRNTPPNQKADRSSQIKTLLKISEPSDGPTVPPNVVVSVRAHTV